MSAVEFGLTPQTSFVPSPTVVPFEQHFADSEAARYVGPFSRTPVSVTTDARLKLLADLSESLVSGALAGEAELESVLTRLNARVRRQINSDFAILGLSYAEDGEYQFMAFDAADDTALSQESVGALAEVFRTHAVSSRQDWTGKLRDLSGSQSDDLEWMAALSMNSCVLPLVSRDRVLGVFALGKRSSTSYTPDELDCLRQVASQVTVVVENFMLHSELKKLKDQSSEEKIFLKDEPSSEPSFEDIVGRSPALHRVLREVDVVAPTDSGVLIQGETGTGKELIAQAIHNRSPRRDRPFVKVNCAAIPSGLLESELFGHEKGAFTGAIMRKPGRFEVADKGTLFLDEVGDIPLDLQSKLLRVLQEREFERLGSTRTQQVDVRVIAATHHDLRKMVEEGTFRSDLYYRLHVFPLVVPPLRDRRDDIPRLVRHYVDKYAKRMNRRIETIPSRTMEVFANYSWPGNVRELQNFIERAVILSPGDSLRAPLEELKQQTVQSPGANSLSTLEEMEREHVLRALRESNWVTGGPNGAAVRLGMKRTTLAYRIRKLKIPIRPQ
jgi:formate hydrogenlyase transcriptional activator